MIERLLGRLLYDMDHVDYSSYMIGRAEKRINELRQRGVHCVDRFIRRLLASISDKEEYLNILMEARFAIMLARNNFSDIYIEYSQVGPDIRAVWNKNIVYFEVTGRHSNVDEWAENDNASFMKRERTENIIDIIRNKVRQLESGEINIVVLWSDTASMGDREVEEAFTYIKQENQETGVYKNISGILFTEGGGISYPSLKQFYLFKNDEALNPLGNRLAKKLESLHERDVKQLQREMEELTTALIKLRSGN